MTKREFYVAIANGMMNEEIQKQAELYIESMNSANEKRKSKMTPKQEENEQLKARIAEMLTNEPQTATVIGEALEITTQKASALMRQMVENGQAHKVDVKIPKKGIQKGYTL